MVKKSPTNCIVKFYFLEDEKNLKNSQYRHWGKKVTCLETDEAGHESYEKLRLLSDQVLLRRRNRGEIINQDQEGRNANLQKLIS